MRSDSASPLVQVEALDAGFEERTVLHGVALALPRRGVMALMGPAGTGKSTLLRTLGRWNDLHPTFWRRGSAWYGERDLLQWQPAEACQRAFPLLGQKARLFTASTLENVIADTFDGRPGDPRPVKPVAKRELAHDLLAAWDLWQTFEPFLEQPVSSLSLGRQRLLSIVRMLAGGAVALLADEPFRDIDEADAEPLATLLRQVAAERPVLMVTHNLRIARELSETVSLLVAGRIVETAPTPEFFAAPKSLLAREFVRLGNCWEIAPPDGPPVAEPPPPIRRRVAPPGTFHWILEGQLAGVQRPGLLQPESQDLEALQALGCRVLVNLTQKPCPPETLRPLGIEGVHFPIRDMGAPSLAGTRMICSQISAWIDGGLPTVVHCKAGLGRTGTLLACVLIFRGENPVRAIHRVRLINPLYIQSEEQLAFIDRFAAYLDEPPEA